MFFYTNSLCLAALPAAKLQDIMRYPIISDIGPTLNQHWFIESFSLGCHKICFNIDGTNHIHILCYLTLLSPS